MRVRFGCSIGDRYDNLLFSRAAIDCEDIHGRGNIRSGCIVAVPLDIGCKGAQDSTAHARLDADARSESLGAGSTVDFCLLRERVGIWSVSEAEM